MKRTITEIEIERRETLIVNFPPAIRRPTCRECGAKQMITPDEAAVVARVGLRAVFRLIETGAIHFEETSGGAVYVCANSFGSGGFTPPTIIFEEKYG